MYLRIFVFFVTAEANEKLHFVAADRAQTNFFVDQRKLDRPTISW